MEICASEWKKKISSTSQYGEERNVKDEGQLQTVQRIGQEMLRHQALSDPSEVQVSCLGAETRNYRPRGRTDAG